LQLNIGLNLINFQPQHKKESSISYFTYKNLIWLILIMCSFEDLANLTDMCNCCTYIDGWLWFGLLAQRTFSLLGQKDCHYNKV